jgi:transcriptional regulator with XRE-family HTH domain
VDAALERRRELGGFLRTRREQLVRADYDLPPVARRRLTGLRREEVAYLAGVSVTWYTWLEQGRDINPSRQVLDALAHTLRLSVAEHHYLLGLAGYAANPPGDLEAVAAVPPHIQRLLDAHLDAPAFALAPDWGIAGWNRAYEALYPSVATVPDEERNLLWLIFTDPDVRRLLPDWEVTAGHFLAEYRAETGAAIGTVPHAALVARLLETSEAFARAWNEHHVERFASRERRFHHPEVGELTFEQYRLKPSDLPDVHVVLYLPSDEATRGKMRALTQLGVAR